MLIEEAIYKILRDDTNVDAIVDGRIYPIILDRKVIYPAVVYRALHGGDHGETLAGGDGLRKTRMGIYSTQSKDEEDLTESPYPIVLRLAEAIREALQGFTGTITSDDSPPTTIKIRNIVAGAFEDKYDDPTETFQRLQIFEVWSEESIPTFS